MTLQSTSDIAPPSFASQEIPEHKFPIIQRFILPLTSIYRHKQRQKKVVLYQGLTLYPIGIFYSFRRMSGHNSFFSENKSSILRCNIGVKTHNTLTWTTSAIQSRTPIYKYIDVFLCYRSWTPRTYTSRCWKNSVAVSLDTYVQVCTVVDGLRNIRSVCVTGKVNRICNNRVWSVLTAG